MTKPIYKQIEELIKRQRSRAYFVIRKSKPPVEGDTITIKTKEGKTLVAEFKYKN
jgi:hypothetical protein